jgi:pyridoxamine 5'-phosphate oxidase
MAGAPLDLAAIRTEYQRAGLAERDLHPSPMRQVEKWLEEAIAAGHPEPTAMTLATATAAGEPAARVVLVKGIDARGLVFFTNYDSDKGREIAQNPRACANLFWTLLERQIRVSGSVEKVARDESEDYFSKRPRESQLGAWASAQSTVLAGREELESRLRETFDRFDGQEVPCPPNWGGYRIVPQRVELWQGRPNRLHDRLRYSLIGTSRWIIERLSP